jgi:hypothetical protein
MTVAAHEQKHTFTEVVDIDAHADRTESELIP